MQTLLKCSMLMCLFFLCVLARGQTPIGIAGPDTLCKGSSGAYVISPTTGYTYTWSVTSQGNISSNGSSGATVVWNGTGLATLTVNGVNGGSTQQGNKTVYVLPPPEPQMTWNAQVGCQITNPLGEGHDSSETSIGNSTCLRVCENSFVTYTVPNGGATSTFAWTVAGGTIISGGATNTCVVQWGSPGNGSITVTETDAYGCSGSKTKCIEIIPGPTADFGVTPGFQACINQPLYFQDQSSVGSGSPIVSWYWDFGDGTYSAVQNPTHVYTSGGNYTVRLIVKNECNCVDTVTYDIEVSDVQAIPIHCPIVVCEGEKDRYWIDLNELAAMGINCTSAVWDASPYGQVVNSGNNGAEEWVIVKWNSAPDPTSPDGFGYLTFDASNCTGTCPGLVVAKVPIIGTETQITGPSTICANKQYRYTLPQWPATLFTWTLSPSTGATLIPTDQPNEYIVQASVGGTYTLKATWKKTMPIECGSSAELQINVEPPVTLSGANKACQNTSENYSLSGTSNPGNWTLNGPGGFLQTGSGLSTFTANFTVPGTYTLTVSGSFCAPDPLIIKVSPTPPVVDSIDGPDTICLNTPYKFTAFDAAPGSNFYWQIVDGGTTTNQANPGEGHGTFTSQTGPYKVRVWRKLKDAPYCESAVLEKILYTPNVVADITGPATVCANTTASYYAGYSGGDTYTWVISPGVDGSIISGTNTANVTVQWNKVTTAHFVDLIVTINKCGIIRTDTLKVWVTPTVAVTINAPTSVCRDQLVNFSLTGSPTLTSYTNITWDFGNNITATGTTTPSYTYTSLSQSNVNYTVTVKVTDPNGCTVAANASHNITVKPSPVANVTPIGPFMSCPANTHSVSLTGTVQSGFGGPATINWYEAAAPSTSLGTGSTSPTFTNNGSYYVVATNTSNGCSSQSNQVVLGTNCPGTPCTISPNPTVSASCSLSNCGEVTVTGSHTGSPVAGPVWIYPPQVTGVSGTNPKVFTFDKAGHYSFTYRVTYKDINNNDCEREDNCMTTVPFIAELKYKLTCGSGNYNLTLLDNSNYVVPITNFAFYLYTGTIGAPAQSGTGTQYTTTVTPGVTYTGALKISAPGYPDCWAYVNIPVPNLPVANFSISHNPGCAGMPIAFDNSSTPNPFSPAPNPDLHSDWDFGDLAGFIGWDASRVYSAAGLFDVVLTVTDKYGCTDVETKTIDIQANLLAGSVTVSPSKFCKGDPVTLSFFNSSGTTVTGYSWKEGSTQIATTPMATVYDPGSYWLTVSGNFGCKKDILPAKAVDYIHVPDAIIDGEKNYCSGEMVVLNGDAGPNVTNYKWYRNTTLIASGNVPVLQDYVPTVGTYIYKLEISVTDGSVTCTNTSADFPVTISMPALAPNLSFTVNDCNTYEVELTATNTVTGTYTWSNGMSGSPITVYEGGPYKVFFQADNGCESSAEIDVPKDPEVYLWVFPTGCKALCKEFFPFWLYGPIIPFNMWEWKEHSGGSTSTGTGLVNPYQVTGAGQYTLTLDNGYCRDRSGILDLTMIKDCCDDVELEVHNVQTVDDNGKCRYDLDVHIHNPGPNDMDVWLSSTWGTFKYGPPPYTGSMTVPNGPHNFQVEFHPNPGFPGGPIWIHIVSQQVTDDGQIIWCKDSIELDFPPCAGPCEVEMSLDDIWIEDPCQIKVRLFMNNMSGVTVNGTFTCPDGTLSPATTSIGTGGNYYTFNFTPQSWFMSGGWSTIKFTTSYMGTDGQMHYCDQEIAAEFPEQCVPEYEPCGFSLYVENFMQINWNPCQYSVLMRIGNPFPGTKPITVTSNVGTFSPSTLSVPSGMFNWISPQPTFTPNPGFPGGMGYIILSSWYLNSNGDTVHCADSFYLYIPGCGDGGLSPKQSNAGEGRVLKDQSPNMFGQLSLAPNPSKGTTTMRYHYTGDDTNHERVIDVYDVMGRLIERIYVKGGSGVHILRLENQPPGVYTVMMKEDGKTIKHEKLVIAK